MKNKVELLCPAGDPEAFEYALAYGADAVYLGAKDFGMRSSCANFSEEEMARAVKMAHEKGKRVYLTLNTLPTNQEVGQLPQTIQMALRAGIDAFIVADLGVMAMLKKIAPEAEFHLSVQAGIMNYASATAAYELGASRVVLARELSLEDIAEIRANTPAELELEVFVHGAMCMGVSGRCLLSSHLAGRDANRGKCTQSCRWKYSLVESSRPGQAYEIGEGEGGSYILSADDMMTLPILDKIVQAGATSLKIEGRGKSFYYVASVTAAYRAALDAVLALPAGQYRVPEFSLQEIEKTSHRPYSPGFYLGQGKATQSPDQANYIRSWKLLGVVQEQINGRLYCQQRGKFTAGQVLEVLTPRGASFSVVPQEILDEQGQAIESTPHPKMLYSIAAPEGQVIPPRSILRMAEDV